MVFLSLRVTADAGGGLKGPAQLRRSFQGFGGGSHQQARAGIYRRIACRYLFNKNAPDTNEPLTIPPLSAIIC